MLNFGAPGEYVNEMFEIDRLTKLIMSLEDHSAQSVVQAIKQKVINFCETIAQQDDVTIFALINRNLPNNNNTSTGKTIGL